MLGAHGGGAALAGGSKSADGGLLYYTDADGQVVFTNTPTPEARPVPGLDVGRAFGVSNANLPATVYDPFIDRVARENGVAPELIKAVALVESGFNPHAVSPKGAQGLMQLMPETARQYGVTDAFDPLANLRAGTVHLRKLLDQFEGDLVLALAAYNAGAGAVKRHGGVPNYKETREYVRKVHDKMGGTRPPRARPKRPPAEPVRLVDNGDGTIQLVN